MKSRWNRHGDEMLFRILGLLYGDGQFLMMSWRWNRFEVMVNSFFGHTPLSLTYWSVLISTAQKIVVNWNGRQHTDTFICTFICMQAANVSICCQHTDTCICMQAASLHTDKCICMQAADRFNWQRFVSPLYSYRSQCEWPLTQGSPNVMSIAVNSK